MIYYIYKVRRKQTSIRFSRFTLLHRYISWISWNGGHRPPQAGFPLVLHPVPQPAHASFSRRCLYPKAAIAALLLLSLPRKQRKYLLIFSPEKKKKHLSSLFSRTFACRSSRVAMLAFPRTRCPRSIRGLSITRSCGPPINKKMRAHGIAPRTRSPQKA